ncbi:NFAT activation molecule 1 [Myripristis murdjan]|uniref:NFAT activation molecule 1 n=1 Tax=Myripristis murdjan TaxID=586833 RepID=UPI0011764559|nr:uncharacterized protein LOC115366146 [Myripristis murdjan]
METQGLWRLSSVLFRIFVFLIPFILSGVDAESFQLEQRVYVALAGEDLQIDFFLFQPANQSGGSLKCFDHKNQVIHSSEVLQSGDATEQIKGSVKLRNLVSSHSGEYHCEYKSARAYWALLVKDEGYWEPRSISDYKGAMIVGGLTSVLLVFSAVGSVYVFTGRWDKACLSAGGGSRRREQGRSEPTREEVEVEDREETAAQASSFYASLEPRPRSIYDVLDHRTATPKQSNNSVEPPQSQEAVFESVYENF